MSGMIRREEISSPKHFTFRDVEKQAAEIIQRARRQAEGIVEKAEQQSRQVNEAHKQEGYAVGLAEGREAGMVEIRKEARQSVVDAARKELEHLEASLQAALREYERKKRGLLASAESGLIELAMSIARRVCRISAERSSEPARESVRSLLELVKHEQDIVLHVNPDEEEMLRDVAADFASRIDSLEHVSVKSDASVPRGGCVLHTPETTIDARIDEQLERVAAALCAQDGPQAETRSDADDTDVA